MQRAMRVNRASDNFGRDLAVVNRIWRGGMGGVGSVYLCEIESCNVCGDEVVASSGKAAAELPHSMRALRFHLSGRWP
jgi:hypothetical protein